MSFKKIRSLSRMRNKAKGPVHTIEIHPARNGRGGHAFTTRVHRHPAPGAKRAPVGTGLGYFPSPAPPDESVHENKADMLDHVGRLAGVPAGDLPEAADDGDEDQDEEE